MKTLTAVFFCFPDGRRDTVLFLFPLSKHSLQSGLSAAHVLEQLQGMKEIKMMYSVIVFSTTNIIM